jgi:hypothetical protein
MDVSPLLGENPSSRVSQDNNAAFRDANFLAIILAEISNQDPFEPMETSKLVENMQKLQDLANTRYTEYRNNLRFAQEIVGQGATVGQANLDDEEYQGLLDRGVNPDRGFGTVSGVVETYRTVGESVWVTIDGLDYPIDNIQRLDPAPDDNTDKAALADHLIGRFVGYRADLQGTSGTGRVSDVRWNSDGEVLVVVDGTEVPFANINRIGE